MDSIYTGKQHGNSKLLLQVYISRVIDIVLYKIYYICDIIYILEMYILHFGENSTDVLKGTCDLKRYI